MSNTKRKPKTTLIVYGKPDEIQQIKENAVMANMTTSGFIKATALGTPLKTKLDLEAIKDLTKLGADQGRLGGLLKMHLTDDDHTPNSRFRAERLLTEILENQTKIKEILKKIR